MLTACLLKKPVRSASASPTRAPCPAPTSVPAPAQPPTPGRGRPVLTSLALLFGLLVAVLASGCAGMGPREKGTSAGAGIGAVTGAVIGSATGGDAGSGAVLGGIAGAVAGNLWSQRLEDKRRAMEQATRGTGASVARTADNRLQVNLPGDLTFDTGRAEIRPELRPVLDQFASGLDPALQVRVVGHTDSTGDASVNDPLSVDRARAVRDYLAQRGVSPQRVDVMGVGSRQPLADNSSDAGRARNRRVELFLSDPGA